MNELAHLVSFHLGLTQNYRIVDREGNLWAAAKDIGKILGIKNYRDAIRNFPENEKSYVVCDVGSTDITSAKPRARKTQKVLIINKEAVFKLIIRSRKPIARLLQDHIAKVLDDITNHGINWAALPKVWYFQGQMLNHIEWMAKKETWYFKRFPDATYDDFLRSRPPYPPPVPENEPPEADKYLLGKKEG
jgi:prophage antirepressor-like protein